MNPALTALVYYTPHVMAVILLATLALSPLPGKTRWLFLAREGIALAVVCILAHINREFDLWPAYRYFTSGHMSFCLGASLSLGLLRPISLAITLPLLIPYGMGLVLLNMHRSINVLGAIPVVLVVFALIRRWWPISLRVCA